MAAVEDVFKALGDPTRVRIVEMLAENGEMCVCRIYERLGMSQPAVSYHLATLKHADLVRARRGGQWIHYSLNRDTLFGVGLDFVRGLIEKLDAAPARMEVCAK